MATRNAGMGAAFVVLAIVLGLITIVGVILLMMWFQPGIEHSPSARTTVDGFRVLVTARVPDFPLLAGTPHFGA